MNDSIYFSHHHKEVQLADLLQTFHAKEVPHFDAFKKFLEYTLVRTQGNEFWQHDLASIKHELLALWKMMQQRRKNQTQIQAIQPPPTESNFTLMIINQDDAPYIVDSLQITLNQLTVHSLPILSIGGLAVLRDHNGGLRDIINDDESLQSEECQIEDPIIIRLPQCTDENKLSQIQEALNEALEEVHITYNDQTLMREKCQAIIDELSEHKRHAPSEEAREAITFLKWLLEDHFYFLGYRQYSLLDKKDGPSLDLISGSGLGLLRDETQAVKSRPVKSMPKEAQRLAKPKHVLVITKTNTKSQVHRPTYTDYISIKHFSDEGKIIGEYRFIGLFSHSAYNESIKQIPFLRQKANAIMAATKSAPTGHRGKSILHILENFPRNDLFQIPQEELCEVVNCILSILERRVTRLIARKDAYGRFYSCLVYIPRDKITAGLSQKISDLLLKELDGIEVSMSLQLDDSILGRLHYVVRIAPMHRDYSDIDFQVLEQKIIELSRSWQEQLKELLTDQNPQETEEMLEHYSQIFSVSYQEDFTPEEALYDIKHIQEVCQTNSIAINLYSDHDDAIRFQLFQLNQPKTLSEIIPILENMGLEAIKENAYRCQLDNNVIWICSYKLRIRENDSPNLEVIKPLFHELFFAIWEGKTENAKLNALVLKCELPWHLIFVLRAYCCYYKLISSYSQSYLEDVLNQHTHISKQILQLFACRFNPDRDCVSEITTLKNEIYKNLSEVSNLEYDKILRTFVDLIEATIRTNYYQSNITRNYICFKFQSGKIPGLPLPHPLYEIFVYSPRFEGIHLRAAKVARGGIRWSDRKEDYRTEVLGLMKAQQVKNTVIVPAGSKGGFILKANTSKMNRNELQDEAIDCYKNFMRGLLSLTDNLVDQKVIAPERLKIYDEADPYLVVAADKGTATFSDYANEVAAEYQFWLGDAFASGGSQGYDHKKIGITARGAWISVETHLKTLGINPSVDVFTAVGIGDMSGDVFGNGMLLSKTVKLLAAFNHLHIFIDPNPDPAQSFVERQRLFNLPRSSWTDYDANLLSPGGAIFDRKAKSISLTPEIKALLELKEDIIEPSNLIQAILCAKVDLLFNGGIGTYVKCSSERNQDVGDKTNDNVRVNANELRCRVVGEGGNLGLTQLARVEFSQNGGLVFTDFIDNSAGVDLSDHEVNIKILLNRALNQGDLKFEDRNQLLSSMTDDVAKLVLRDNKDQTGTLSFANSQAESELEIYMRCINQYEQKGIINRAVESLPSEKNLEERFKIGKGLTAPEIAVVMAYVKMDIKQAILKSNIPDTEFFQSLIQHEFPITLNKRYHDLMLKHQLHREIITTQLTNQLLKQAGILFIPRLQEETNAKIPQIIRAYTVIAHTFDLPLLYAAIDSLDFQVDASIQNQMRRRLQRVLRRATRWLLRHQLPGDAISETIDALALIKPTIPKLSQLLRGVALEKHQQLIQIYTDANVPEKIAMQIVNAYKGYLLLDVNAIALETKISGTKVASIYFELGQKLGLDWLREEITNQTVVNHWEGLAHSSLRDKLDYLQATVTKRAIQMHTKTDHLESWLEKYPAPLQTWRNILSQLQHANKTDYVMYSVALNMLNNLINTL